MKHVEPQLFISATGVGNIRRPLEQAERNAGKGSPLLLFRRNGSRNNAVVPFDALLERRM